MDLSFKWQKILLLHFFNLATKAAIEEIAHRFSLDDVDVLIKHINKNITNSTEECVYVVELISVQHRYKLPTYIVKNQYDLTGIVEFVNKNHKINFSEIWYYRKPKIQACGRILFKEYPLYNQAIEIIEGDTIRAIETGEYKAYFRAERIGWGWQYKIMEHRISDGNKILKQYQQEILGKIFVEIENRKTQVENLSSIFQKWGLDVFTLDFILMNNRFYIIDWDTGNDKIVYQQLKASGFNDWNNYYMKE